MAELNMVKGQKLDLSKEAPGITKFRLGLGWKPNQSLSASTFDLDAFAILAGPGRSYQETIYFNHKSSDASGFLTLDKDNLTGEGEGADENMYIDCSKWPTGTEEVLIGCNIYQNVEKNQNFGQVDDAFIEICDGVSNTKIANFDLTEDGSIFTYYVLGRLYMHNGAVKFEATGKGGKAPSISEIKDTLATL